MELEDYPYADGSLPCRSYGEVDRYIRHFGGRKVLQAVLDVVPESTIGYFLRKNGLRSLDAYIRDIASMGTCDLYATAAGEMICSPYFGMDETTWNEVLEELECGRMS